MERLHLAKILHDIRTADSPPSPQVMLLQAMSVLPGVTVIRRQHSVPRDFSPLLSRVGKWRKASRANDGGGGGGGGGGGLS